LNSGLVGALSQVAGLLDDAGFSWCLVGGLAVSVRCEPRFTRDVDLAVRVLDDTEAERVSRLLLGSGYELLSLIEHDKTGRLATARFRPPRSNEHGVTTDLLFASSGIEPEVVDGAEALELLPGKLISVATVPHLLAMKLLSHDSDSREQDAIDIKHLLRVATPSERAMVTQLIGLIHERGCNRGKDLPLVMNQFLTRAGIEM